MEIFEKIYLLAFKIKGQMVTSVTIGGHRNCQKTSKIVKTYIFWGKMHFLNFSPKTSVNFCHKGKGRTQKLSKTLKIVKTY
jgi:hypothetical protein